MTAGDQAPRDTLDWYRQASNWMAGLSTGAVAAGVLMSPQIKPASSWVKVTFLLAGFFFVCSIFVAMVFHFWIIKYAAVKARKQEVTEPTRGETTPPAETTRLDSVIDAGKKALTLLHLALLILFPLGALFASAGVLGLFVPSPEKEGNFVVVSVAGDSTGGLQRDRKTLLVNEVDGRTWELSKNADGQLLWICLPRVPEFKPDSCRMMQSRITRTGGTETRQDLSTKGTPSVPTERKSRINHDPVAPRSARRKCSNPLNRRLVPRAQKNGSTSC